MLAERPDLCNHENRMRERKGIIMYVISNTIMITINRLMKIFGILMARKMLLQNGATVLRSVKMITTVNTIIFHFAGAFSMEE